MKIRADLRFWLEAESLADAEQAIKAAQAAAYEALGNAAIDDPDTGAVYASSYDGIDEAAIAALTKDDMGPGRDEALFRLDESDA